ncbi:Pro-interleukin-16 [Frankliniella fusca]|uniref:Pro-interleukin-16 n=1 Tax=Frankliniella fusca TaxID=407009 RepID=A0AAE1HM39_9NEOP|nr:Pro-interleukin-16 [Frankliniella fusca]
MERCPMLAMAVLHECDEDRAWDARCGTVATQLGVEYYLCAEMRGVTTGVPVGPLQGPSLGQGPHNPMPVRSAPAPAPAGPPSLRVSLGLAGPRASSDQLGSAPPSASRQPPDGDEFPPRYHDQGPLGPGALLPAHEGKTGVSASLAPPPPLPLTNPPAMENGRGWRKDERSERSVRDKIAMFTTACTASVAAAPAPPPPASLTRRLSNKFKSTEDVFSILGGDVVDAAAPDAKARSRSVVAVDRVGKPSSPETPPLSSASSSSSAYSSFCSPETSLSPTLNGSPFESSAPSSTLPRKSGPVVTRATSFSGHPRSAPATAPHHTSNGSNGANGANGAAVDEARRASLLALVEQRRRSISKLRGLVIPDKVPDQGTPVVDLPEIRSKDALLIASSQQQQRYHHDVAAAYYTPVSQQAAPPTAPVLSSPPWKSQGASNLPKYSPAFKRKSLTVRSVSATPLLPSKPSHDLLIGDLPAKTTTTTTPPSSAFLSDSGRSAEEESDNDSAVSSSRSSISHGFSPPASPLLPSVAAGPGRAAGPGPALRRTLSSDTTVSSATSQGEADDAEDDEEASNEDAPPKVILRRDPREEIKELERMVSMADTDVESNDALSCDDSVNSSDDTLEPSHAGRVHYRPATLRDLPAADVKVAFLNDTQNIGIELDLLPMSKSSAKAAGGSSENSTKASSESNISLLSKAPDDSRKILQPPSILPKPLSRKSSIDAHLNGSDTTDNGSINSASESTPRLRNLKKRNASDPLFLERNGNTSRNPTALHAVSVNDIRKAFEKAELALSPTSPSPSNGKMCLSTSLNGVTERLNGSTSSGSSMGGGVPLVPSHARGSSIDSTTSEDGFPGHLSKEQFGSITSLASTTSLISQQELQQLIDDANQTLEEANNNGTSHTGSPHEVLVVILHRETSGASVGITLAGGADYETKEITVHKVLTGSPAERDGRLQKGDRILSINGRNMKGVTHRESLAILKAPRPEVVLVVSRTRGEVVKTYEDSTNSNPRIISRPPRILEQPLIDPIDTAVPRGPPVNIMLLKDGAGLGFSLEGGKDSPLGDRPLTIKKIFTGGCAEKSGNLQAGDELLSVNNTDVTKLSRIEAWGLMKRLPNGNVTLTVRHACVNATASEN